MCPGILLMLALAAGLAAETGHLFTAVRAVRAGLALKELTRCMVGLAADHPAQQRALGALQSLAEMAGQGALPG